MRFVTAGRVRGDASTPRLKTALSVHFLEFQSGDRSGERLTIAEGRILVGRHPDCDIVLDVPSVSRQHCAVSVTAEAATVEDLRSRNGTLLNGVPLSAPKRLEHGDELVICGHRLTFLAEAVAPT